MSNLQEESKRPHTALEALNGSSQLFELLVKSVEDYAIFMLDPDGIVISWNKGAERIKSYKAEEIIGQSFSQFYTQDDRERGLPKKALETAVQEGHFEGEAWRVRKDGTKFFASVVLTAVRNDAG